MSRDSFPPPDPLSRPDADTLIVRVAGGVIAAYLIATFVPMVRYVTNTAQRGPLIAHLCALALALLMLAPRERVPRTVRDAIPLLLGPFLYVELRWLVPGAGRPHSDPTVIAWEQRWFPGNPSSTWAHASHPLLVSEALHFAYASYYALILLPPILLYARHRRDEYARTLLALVLVYGACFAVYLLFPVDGPRFLFGPAPAPDGPIRRLVLSILASGSSRGTAFPSSHVAASVVASLCALQFQRRIGVVVSVLTVGLTLATVYGGFHYAVDAVAGLIAGILCWAAAAWLARRLSVRGAHSATAA
jgi:membrane-associated phospholipid phosphatase